MSSYRVEIDYVGSPLCPWRYRVYSPAERLIESCAVLSREYAEKAARATIDREKERLKGRYTFEVPA